MKIKNCCVSSFPLQRLHVSSLLNKLGNAYLCLLYKMNVCFASECYVNITSKYLHITTRFTGLKRSECLCSAFELSVKKIGAWTQKGRRR